MKEITRSLFSVGVLGPMHSHNEGIHTAILLFLSLVAGTFGVFAAVMYALLQPIVIQNPGVVAVSLRPKPAIGWSLTLADRQRMEKAALEEANQANEGELVSAFARSEPRDAAAQAVPSQKRLRDAGPRRMEWEAAQRPQQLSNVSAATRQLEMLGGR